MKQHIIFKECQSVIVQMGQSALGLHTHLINKANGTTSMIWSVTWGDRPTWVSPEYRKAPATPAPPVPEPQAPSTSLPGGGGDHKDSIGLLDWILEYCRK